MKNANNIGFDPAHLNKGMSVGLAIICVAWPMVATGIYHVASSSNGQVTRAALALSAFFVVTFLATPPSVRRRKLQTLSEATKARLFLSLLLLVILVFSIEFLL
jgi:hypothetical protein